MSVTRRPSSRSRNIWTVAGPRSGSASATARPRSISSGSAIAAPLIDSPPRDSSIVRGIAFRQRPSRSQSRSTENSGPSMQPLDHHRLLDVAGEELRLALVGARVDRARAGALARLDHRGIAVGGLARQPGRRARQAVRLEQLVREVLVERGLADLGVRHEGRQVAAREHLEVEVGERDHGAHVVALDQLGQERDVARVVGARRRDAHVGGVLRGRQRARVGGDDERVPRERR